MAHDALADAALVLLGHGTTQNEDSAAPVYQHAAELRRRKIFADVREAFWKQEPQVINVLAQLQTPRVFIVPLFISEGYFSSEVIPRELGLDADLSLQTSAFRLVYCRPIGTHDSMTCVLLARARDVVEQFPFPRAPKPKDLTLFIAGHGTERSDKSRKAIERQVELLRAQNLYAGVHAIFLEESPRIADCYQLSETRNIVVVPFFISDGLHTREDIPVLLGEPKLLVQQRFQSGQPTWRNPTEKNGKLVWYSAAVGSELHIADVILERVRENRQFVAPLNKTIFHLPSSILYPSGVRWNKTTIVGVGLLGGSLGLAVRRRKLAREVAGFVRRTASLKDCEKAGAVDYATTDLLAAVSNADLVILCTPLAQMRPLVRQLLPALKRGAIVTDVGSVKASVVQDLETLVAKAGAHFVGSHPMAGAEKTSVAWSRANLYDGSACVVTPTRRTNKAALRKVEAFWKSVGGRVMRLPPETHDTLVSRSSHLPHVVAATLATVVLDPKWPEQQAALCANGFRDTTRIASGSPEMWRDIAVANRRNLAKSLDRFIAELKTFRRTLAKSDVKAVSKLFETAKQRRDDWCSRTASPSPE